ncbi:hypothetical protein CHS0354_003860 [Potamilus streckersoni]|uniref:MAM domain-containing protein n=1 Tax=Potamilus streckersoni TaxID=2493646 RepID=A0AAE0SGF2_9BIVA|nr:hypothetical protein CHS0354_003860 [Potamilus streckersoni]
MKDIVAAFSFTFLIIIVSLTGAICRQDTCNFDNGLCGWVQGESDNFNWIRTSGGRSTINTGPKHGHTTGNDMKDYYMIIDASGRKEGNRAVLKRMGFDYEGRACLSFWYHMYGLHMGTLNINVIKNTYYPLLVWSKTGSQSESWTHAAVDLEIGYNAMIEFEAIRGNGPFGNMALDDVSLTHESCFNCVFDDDFCLWKDNQGWKLSPNEAKSGMYATTHASQGCVPYTGVNHILRTPVHAMQGPVYISFLYFLNGSDIRLQLYIISPAKAYILWKGSSCNTWRIISVFVNESLPNFTLEFEVYTGPSCLGQTGLKNVTVVMGKCQGSTTVISKRASHPSVTEFQTTSSTDLIHESDNTKRSDAAIIGSVAGSLVFVVVLAFVAVGIFRKKQCLKERNSGNAVFQLPSNETLQHGENTGDYLHVVFSSNPNSSEYYITPLPHSIVRNNDNEYDYVS